MYNIHNQVNSLYHIYRGIICPVNRRKTEVGIVRICIFIDRKLNKKKNTMMRLFVYRI
ncbi:unnamed protein product [Schistosoma curassoni]|uniref:Uncharacterized protein n=1 Tax=Schistosoma curassoni TaxID=6186 RepID=A0A183JWP8_9TREM|nr:unnamed protein product [Schistosoma curassoni]